ncbi:MAG TPA: DMT family transporter [Lacunisphaera sp.]|nr:DMT family transporter [Lacunisphaera sp.]
MSSSAHRRALWLMLLSASAFTANVLLVRALSDLHFANIWLVSCARFLVGLGVVAVVYREEWRPLHLVRNAKLIQRGLAGGIGVYLTYLCVVKLGAGRATFINNTYVIWGALLAAWVLRERLQPALLVGGAMALGGLALLTNILGSGTRPGVYDALAVASALISAWVVVTIRQLHATEHSSTIFAAQCLYGLVLCGLPACLQLQPISGVGLAVTAVASLAAAVGQLAMTRAFRDLSVAEGSLLQMLVPVGIAAGGVGFFHEHFSLHELAGATLILGGTAFTALRQAPRTVAPAE